jgi:hypothetical protein
VNEGVWPESNLNRFTEAVTTVLSASITKSPIYEFTN